MDRFEWLEDLLNGSLIHPYLADAETIERVKNLRKTLVSIVRESQMIWDAYEGGITDLRLDGDDRLFKALADLKQIGEEIRFI